ncbi:MAG: 23S rRNA (uracil(1939)-C(5))-methyltransferase RlmD [Candidatus Amulumruptor caecigallinarius]|nr:23S rRNA (uracil(1939)-C(5))-methyltransferase RlmD [Candidatus Amulumruptor caecigallinarius]
MARKKKPLPELKSINIESVAAEGKSLARVKLRPEDESSIVVFIPYGAPGDVADVQIDRKKHSFAEAHITRLVRPSEKRVHPECRHFGLCGGCKWQHLPYNEQLYWKQKQVEDALQRIAKVELPDISPILGSKRIWHYRNKMEYTFSNKKWRTWEQLKSGKEFTDSPDALGFHIPGAFDKVLHIEECKLQDELGNRIRNFIYNYAEENEFSFYDIRNNDGLLRTLMIRIASTGEVMVCVVFGENRPKEINSVMNALAEEFPEITSLVYVVNLKLNDSISDQEICVFKGREYIEEEMEGLRFRINAKSFYQTNSLQAYELYKVARKFAGLDKVPAEGECPLVYDLYTGTGTIANFVARNARKVVGIEYVEESIADAKVNSIANGIGNTLFYAGDMKDVLTDEFISLHGKPDVMIIDPPRAGMHEDVVKVILNAAPEVLVYVSCNPATQARDITLLNERYKVTDIQPVDMFPHTHHVENVVRLQLR